MNLRQTSKLNLPVALSGGSSEGQDSGFSNRRSPRLIKRVLRPFICVLFPNRGGRETRFGVFPQKLTATHYLYEL